MVNPIRSLHLRNFGPHQDLRVDFEAGLNLIRARNRSGKSWVLRALSLLLYNYCPASYNKDDALCEIRYRDPADPNARRSRFFSITAEFADGSRVTRYRDADRNEYVVERPNQGPVTYQAVGAGFFEPVGQVTGIFPLCLDGKTDYRLNVKLNTDHLFLLGESGAKQDDILTRLLGLNVISAAETLTEKDIRDLAGQLDARTNEEARLSAEVHRLEDAPEVKVRAERLDGKLRALTQMDQTRARAVQLLGAVDQHRAERVQCAQVVQVLQVGAGDLTAWLERAGEIARKAGEARRVLGTLAGAREEGLAVGARVRYLREALGKLHGLLDSALRHALGAQAAREVGGRIAQLQAGRAQQVARIQTIQQQLQQAEATYQQILRDAGVCPLCGQATQ
jgi:hypothetical protein